MAACVREKPLRRKSQTQFSPSIYELYHGAELLQSETMDFQTHLYRYGEMDEYLRGCGFKKHIRLFQLSERTRCQ